MSLSSSFKRPKLLTKELTNHTRSENNALPWSSESIMAPVSVDGLSIGRGSGYEKSEVLLSLVK